MESNYRTIIAAGKPGVGKSYLGNFLLSGNPNSQIFKSETNAVEFGVTKAIQTTKQYANHLNCTLEYIDIPGSGDPTISIVEMSDDLVNKLSTKTINAALMLVNTQDVRASASEVLTISFLKNFFTSRGISTRECLWLVFTRCQEKLADNQLIQQKLTFLKNTGLDIREDHVIHFDNTLDSLNPFIKEVFKINQNNGLQVEKDTKKAMENFTNDLRQVSIKDPQIRQEFSQFEKLMEMMAAQNENLSKQLSGQMEVLKAIVNNQQPVQVRRPRCNLI